MHVCLPCGALEHIGKPQDERRKIHYAYSDRFREYENSERKRDKHRDCLCYLYENALIEVVNDVTGDNAEREHRCKPKREHGSKEGSRPSELENEPSDRHHLHPCADV